VFSLPQDDLSQVLAKVRSGAALVVDAFDRDDRQQIAEGKLLGIDNQIDPNTGTYKLKAVFENDDESLFPNQFVNVRLQLDALRGVTLLPSAALQRGQEGTFVYVVGEDQTAKVRTVEVALTEGSDAAVKSGVAPGENVVVDGQDKLRDGSKVDLGGHGEGEGSSGAGTGRAGGQRGGKKAGKSEEGR
jgi:membrane fusion protein, multidrug efflux system